MKKLMISFSVFTISLFVFVLSSCNKLSSASKEQSSGNNVLSCKISAPKEVKAGKPLPLRFELTNNGGKDIYVLKWHTPFEGIRNDIFRVTRNGKEMDYQGIMAERANPKSMKSYMLLKAKGSKTASINLVKYYDFSKPGLYTISYVRENLFDHSYSVEDLPRKLDAFQPINIKCNELKVRITP